MQQTQSNFDPSPPPALDIRRHALFLDLDGTLVDFQIDPSRVLASDDVRRLTGELTQALDGALALLTGRTIPSADAVIGSAIHHIAGVHGSERRPSGAVEAAPASTAIAMARDEAHALIAAGAFIADIEDKGAALALHYRRTPAERDRVRSVAKRIAARHGLAVLDGNMVVELKNDARNKGDALTEFMAMAPFAGRTPIAVGDDVTDEDAFRAALSLGGFAILVGERRATAATYHLSRPSDVIAWLRASLSP